MPRPANEKRLITDALARTARCAVGQRERNITDTQVPGLTLRVSAGGHRSWSLRFRVAHEGFKGRQQRRRLGAYPDMTLDAARTAALKLVAAAAGGKAPTKRDVAAFTVADLADEFVEEHVKPREKKAKQTEELIKQHIVARIGTRRLMELQRGDIYELVATLRSTGLTTQVNRVLTKLKTMLNWAVDRELLASNPAARVRKPIKEAERKRVLTANELRALWQTAAGLSDPSRAFVELLMLTGQRRDEVRALPWSEIDADKALWTLPSGRTKTRKGDHLVPLSSDAANIVARLSQAGAFAISVSGKKPYAGQVRLKGILDKGMIRRLREAGALAKDAELPGWTLHDIRRTVASGMGELGIPQEVIARCLNHRPPGGITNVYNRHEYADEKRAAFEAWARRLAAIVGQGRDAANVVQIYRS